MHDGHRHVRILQCRIECCRTHRTSDGYYPAECVASDRASLDDPCPCLEQQQGSRHLTEHHDPRWSSYCMP
jgi:hypothetical protein